MERLLTNIMLLLLVITGLLRDTSEVCEEIEYNEEIVVGTIKTVINHFENIVLINLRKTVNIFYVPKRDYKSIKVKVSSERHNRFSDVNYIECMRC